MSSLSRSVMAIAVLGCVFVSVARAEAVLKICADPANLPFSDRNQAGFENKIAAVLASQLGMKPEFHWARMGRGFVREVVDKGACDVLMGVPVGMRGVLVTRPYYRSDYVFVTRKGRKIQSLDDPTLKRLKIGVQVLEDDYAPPARALSRRGMAGNIVGFDMDDPAAIIAGVAKRKVDVAIVWGPIAGYFARKYGASLNVTPVSPEFDPPALPLAYEIAAGVRKSDPQLYDRLNVALLKAAPKIQRILKSYNIPTLPQHDHAAIAGGG